VSGQRQQALVRACVRACVKGVRACARAGTIQGVRRRLPRAPQPLPTQPTPGMQAAVGSACARQCAPSRRPCAHTRTQCATPPLTQPQASHGCCSPAPTHPPSPPQACRPRWAARARGNARPPHSGLARSLTPPTATATVHDQQHLAHPQRGGTAAAREHQHLPRMRVRTCYAGTEAGAYAWRPAPALCCLLLCALPPGALLDVASQWECVPAGFLGFELGLKSESVLRSGAGRQGGGGRPAHLSWSLCNQCARTLDTRVRVRGMDGVLLLLMMMMLPLVVCPRAWPAQPAAPLPPLDPSAVTAAPTATAAATATAPAVAATAAAAGRAGASASGNGSAAAAGCLTCCLCCCCP